MRDRKKQRELRKSKEKRLNRRDPSGYLDLTPYEAVNELIRKEKVESAAGEKKE